MLKGKKIVVILPAYNAAKTLRQTYDEIPWDIVDDVVLTDDGSSDNTYDVARHLGITNIWRHDINKGYGANQKTCYKNALKLHADIIVMLHPDYQYTPLLIESMVLLIANDLYPVVLGSRILGNGALKGGMPFYKYVSNRMLTFIQNLATGAKLSEYHTGYRAFRADVLSTIDFERNSDDFVFDNEMLSQIIMQGFPIGEITCPTKYDHNSSSINFTRSVQYGLGVLRVSMQHLLHRLRILKNPRYLLKNAKASQEVATIAE